MTSLYSVWKTTANCETEVSSYLVDSMDTHVSMLMEWGVYKSVRNQDNSATRYSLKKNGVVIDIIECPKESCNKLGIYVIREFGTLKPIAVASSLAEANAIKRGQSRHLETLITFKEID
jgi:hypothetical protein